MTVSAQTRRNRSVAGRKAAEAKKLRRSKYGPEGSHRGTVKVESFETIMARLRARDPSARSGDPSTRSGQG
ncbi:MAG: hypothetical protein QOH04_2602 [Sphingomonadales bacterium]|jgi:hypothetical protein|nr:hypothetical protein [Sphingomonadales bacterium]